MTCPYYPPCNPNTCVHVKTKPPFFQFQRSLNSPTEQQQLPLLPPSSRHPEYPQQPLLSAYDNTPHSLPAVRHHHPPPPTPLLPQDRYYYSRPVPSPSYAPSTQRSYAPQESHRSTSPVTTRSTPPFQRHQLDTASFIPQIRPDGIADSSKSESTFTGEDSSRNRPSPSPATASFQRRRNSGHQISVCADDVPGASIKVVLQKQTGDITSIVEGDNERLMIYEGFGYDVQLSWKPWSPLQSAGKGIYARIYYAVVGGNGLMYDLYPANWFHWQERNSSVEHYPTWSRCYTYVLDLAKVSPPGSSSRGEPRADDLRPKSGNPTITNPPYYKLEFGTADSYEDAAATVSSSKVPVIHREFMVHSKRTAYHHRKKRKHGDQTTDEIGPVKGADASVATA